MLHPLSNVDNEQRANVAAVRSLLPTVSLPIISLREQQTRHPIPAAVLQNQEQPEFPGATGSQMQLNHGPFMPQQRNLKCSHPNAALQEQSISKFCPEQTLAQLSQQEPVYRPQVPPRPFCLGKGRRVQTGRTRQLKAQTRTRNVNADGVPFFSELR